MGQTFDPSGRIDRSDLPGVDQEHDHDEDQLGFAYALRLAIPLGLGFWALAIWGAARFFF